MKKNLKLFLPFILIILGLMLVVFQMDRTLREIHVDKEADHISWQVALQIKNELDQVTSDLNFLSGQLIAKELLKTADENARAELSLRYLDFINAHPEYAQIRLLDENGMELARVERKNHGSSITPKEKLQDKSSRYYFQDAKTLAAGEIYQSPFDLNMEHGKIEFPWNPMIRFATPIITENQRGYIILNLSGQHLFDKIGIVTDNHKGKVFIVNKDGYYLYSPTPERNWGFMLNQPENTLAKDKPGVWDAIQKDMIQFHSDNGHHYYSMRKVCSAENCSTALNLVYLNSNSSDLPWIVVDQAEALTITNLQWSYSHWPYLLAFLMLIMTMIALRIISRLSASDQGNIDKQKELEKSSQRFQKVLSSLPDGLIILNPQSQIEIVNTAVLNIFGRTEEELIGHPIETLMTGRFKENHYAKTESFFKNPRRIEVTREKPYKFKHPDRGDCFVQAIIEPFYFEKETYAIVLIKEVTLSLKQEEQIRQSQKLDALGQLTGGVAHDFNNLLGVMLGNLELLELQLADDEKLLTRIHKISKAVDTASELTQKLLSISRRKSLKTEVVAVEPFMQDFMDLLHRTIKERIEIQLVMQNKLPNLEIDPHELTNALLNLSINARDAMPEGGNLLFQLEVVNLDAEYMKTIPEPIAPGDYLLIDVSDTGTGIPKELISKVLEPFFTTKPKGKGTGLGLAMIYGFVKQSHGHMRIYSEVDKGTSIHLYLPLAKAQSATNTNVHSTLSAYDDPKWQGLRALVVDDEVDLADVASAHLSSLGFECDQAHHAQQAWDKLRTQTYDLVLSDIVMPGDMNGLDLYQKVKQSFPKTTMILVSGFSEEMLSKQHQTKKEMIFLKKPYKRQQIIQALKGTDLPPSNSN